jgi:hypothetical protein
MRKGEREETGGKREGGQREGEAREDIYIYIYNAD